MRRFASRVRSMISAFWATYWWGKPERKKRKRNIPFVESP